MSKGGCPATIWMDKNNESFQKLQGMKHECIDDEGNPDKIIKIASNKKKDPEYPNYIDGRRCIYCQAAIRLTDHSQHELTCFGEMRASGQLPTLEERKRTHADEEDEEEEVEDSEQEGMTVSENQTMSEQSILGKRV